MSKTAFIELADRAVLSLAGAEARSFLQGLVTNNVDLVGEDRAIYAALLTPQGKFLFDFLLGERGGRLLLDCEADRAADLAKRLIFYRLRAKVQIEPETTLAVFAVFGDAAAERLDLPLREGAARALDDGLAFVDPRAGGLGVRLVLPRKTAAATLDDLGLEAGDRSDYERLRLELGVPDGSRDIQVDKNFLLEGNFEALNGVDFKKGCFVGQELTARTKYRGNVRRRLYRVDVAGPLPDPDTPVMLGETEIGTLRTGLGGRALAMLRIADAEGAIESDTPLTAGETTIKPIPN